LSRGEKSRRLLCSSSPRLAPCRLCAFPRIILHEFKSGANAPRLESCRIVLNTLDAGGLLVTRRDILITARTHNDHTRDRLVDIFTAL
jgi:hypothetical protein